jgi:hypothetical protein
MWQPRAITRIPGQSDVAARLLGTFDASSRKTGLPPQPNERRLIAAGYRHERGGRSLNVTRSAVGPTAVYAGADGR